MCFVIGVDISNSDWPTQRKENNICVVPIGNSLRMATSTIPRHANKEKNALNFDCLLSQRLQKFSKSFSKVNHLKRHVDAGLFQIVLRSI